MVPRPQEDRSWAPAGNADETSVDPRLADAIELVRVYRAAAQSCFDPATGRERAWAFEVFDRANRWADELLDESGV